MAINEFQAQEFKTFFSGDKDHYGLYLHGESHCINNKPVTFDLYMSHLKGEKGLGIIPIFNYNNCFFCVVNVNIYKEMDLYLNAIDRLNFPFVPFWSKSGGLHLYLFFEKPENVKKAVDLCRQMCFLLGLDQIVKKKNNDILEIFPKQNVIRKGEIGDWINLPYFDAELGKRCAISNGINLTLNDALMLIKNKRTTLIEIESFLKSLDYWDAPPCLQIIFILNPFQNKDHLKNALYSLGVYLKAREEDFFEPTLRRKNSELKNALSNDDMINMCLSLKEKNTSYKCKDIPCSVYCNKIECSKREFGKGKEGGYFSEIEFGAFRQFKTGQSYYEWEIKKDTDVEFKVLRFRNEKEIRQQDTFLDLCMSVLLKLPPKLKQSVWFSLVNQALENAEVINIDEDDDTSPSILLRMYIIKFLERPLANKMDQIKLGRVFFDDKYGEYCFRVKDLLHYLFTEQGFRYYAPGELHGYLKDNNFKKRILSPPGEKKIRAMVIHKKHVKIDKLKDVFEPDFAEEENEHLEEIPF